MLDIKTKSTYNGSLTGTLTAEHGNRDRRRDEVQGNLFNADGENTSLTLRSDNLSNMNIGGNNFQNILSGNIVKKFGKKITLNASLSLNAFTMEARIMTMMSNIFIGNKISGINAAFLEQESQ